MEYPLISRTCCFVITPFLRKIVGLPHMSLVVPRKEHLIYGSLGDCGPSDLASMCPSSLSQITSSCSISESSCDWLGLCMCERSIDSGILKGCGYSTSCAVAGSATNSYQLKYFGSGGTSPTLSDLDGLLWLTLQWRAMFYLRIRSAQKKQNRW